MKRTVQEGPYPHHTEGCKERYNKPALYCKSCYQGTQMSFFISDEVEKEVKEEVVQEAQSKNAHPERHIPMAKCICGLLYDMIEWESDIKVRAECSTCGDISKQKCSKDFINKGYRWR